LPTFLYGVGIAVVRAYETKQGGKRYRVRYRTPDNRQTDKRGFRTKAEATRFANTVEVAKLKGEYVNPADARRTVDTLGQAWLARQKGPPEALRICRHGDGVARADQTALG
jgi:hypothetical protein